MKRTRKKQNLGMPIFENPPPIPKQLSRIFVGIDNGVSGGITIMDETEGVIQHIKTPIKNCLNYTKKKAFIKGMGRIIARCGLFL